MRLSWLIVLALAAVGAGGVALFERQPALSEKPQLALLTSLPLLFGEDFALDVPKVAAVARIERDFIIAPIAIADTKSLRKQSLLLMAHPRAQPAEVLVELDAWVRQGGRVVVLADPSLKWESSRPFGDALRPPPDFADTGLLQHWGLRMAIDDAREGSLRATDENCAVREQGLMAICRVGRGRATVIADADFILHEGDDADRRLELMMTELTRSASR